MRVPVRVFSPLENTPATRPLRGLLPPPPSRGGGRVSGDCPDGRARNRNGISRTVSVRRQRDAIPGLRLDGESPPGGIVAYGEGDGKPPPLLSSHILATVWPLNTPISRPLRLSHLSILKNLSRLKHCASVNTTQPRKMFAVYFSPGGQRPVSGQKRHLETKRCGERGQVCVVVGEPALFAKV